MVIWRIQPPALSSRRSTSCGTGSLRHCGSWAPLRASARNGPSRCAPRTSGRSAITRLTAATFLHITSIGFVISESTWRVVPCTICPALASEIASAPSSYACAHAPCAWISIYPGVSVLPAASITAIPESSPSAFSAENLRRAASKSPLRVPAAAITPSSEISQKFSWIPRASILRAFLIAKRPGFLPKACETCPAVRACTSETLPEPLSAVSPEKGTSCR